MINLKMADGIRLMTLRRGVDPRKFALLSFGGAAGLHAAEVARELEIKRIIVPTVASVLSAWGMLTSDLRYEMSRTHYGAGSAFRPAKCVSCSPNWSSRPPAGCAPGSTVRCRSSAPPRCATASRCSRSTCSLDGLDWNAADLVDQIEQRFHRRARGTLHLRLARPGGGVRQRARRGGRRSRAKRSEHAAGSIGGACSPRSTRQAFFGGWREVPVYALDDLRPGHSLIGPAIIEAETTTVLVDDGDRVTRQCAWLARYCACADTKFDFIVGAGLSGTVAFASIQAWR